MPFIGQQPTQGRFIELDSLTASATANYTLQLNSANYYPESVNNLLVSINGVIQGSSTMSLNGAVLTVGATLSSSDTIDFVRVFGNVGTVSTPTDGSVTANKIGSGAITNVKVADNAGIVGSKLGTGAVLQFKEGGRTDRFVGTGGSSFADCGVSVDITPSYTSSKILVRVSGSLSVSGGGTLGGSRAMVKVFRDSTEIGSGTSGNTYNVFMAALLKESYQMHPFSQSTLDSPSSTSSITYKIQIASTDNQCVIGGRGESSEVAVPTRIEVMEIGG
tara:strand:- start:1292 stop:2119 length:828 start_codon:yes stop_codon:yes gene_type:complete